MSKFCTNCGNQLDDEAVFCDNCGKRIVSQTNSQPMQTPLQPNAQTEQQYAQPAQQYAPDQQYYQPNQPMLQNNPQPPKKKAGLIIGLICGGVAVLAAAVLVVIFVIMPQFKKPGGSQQPTPPAAATEIQTEPATEAMTDAPTQAVTEAPTQAPTEAPTEAPTVAPTETVKQPPAALPFVDTLGKASPTDFAWISDAYGLQGSFLGKEELLGKWKAEFIFDGVWEMVYITIDENGTVTVQPDQINYGDGWESEAGDASYSFSGSFDINRVYGSGENGQIDLYHFLESHGTQYALGELNAKTGNTAKVYMIRP